MNIHRLSLVEWLLRAMFGALSVRIEMLSTGRNNLHLFISFLYLSTAEFISKDYIAIQFLTSRILHLFQLPFLPVDPHMACGTLTSTSM